MPWRALVLAAALLAAACSALPVPKRASYHAADADLSVTRIVHGAVILELGGTRLLVDPWFHSGFIVRQREPLGLTPEGLPSFTAVLLTHRHGDHFDETALARLAATVPTVVARAELHARLVKLGFRRVVDLDWWDEASLDGVTVTAVPARHGAPENGYVVEGGRVQVYVAGDTRYFPELVDVATRFPHLDAALLPVGGERYLGFGREMGPADAARAAAPSAAASRCAGSRATRPSASSRSARSAASRRSASWCSRPGRAGTTTSEHPGASARMAPALRRGAFVEVREHPQQTGLVEQALPCPAPGKHHVPRLAGVGPLT